MGVIVKEEYVCDYCAAPITDNNILIGKLALRKQGARGLGREVALTLHPDCSEALTRNAPSAPRTRRRREPAAAVEVVEIIEEVVVEEPAAPKPRARRRKAEA